MSIEPETAATETTPALPAGLPAAAVPDLDPAAGAGAGAAAGSRPPGPASRAGLPAGDEPAAGPGGRELLEPRTSPGAARACTACGCPETGASPMYDAGYALYCADPADCEARRDAAIIAARRAQLAADAEAAAAAAREGSAGEAP